jgi:hypothetical protein
MGITDCKSHGRQFIWLVCPHLQRATNDHQIIGGWAKVGITLDGDIVHHHEYCFDCAAKFKVPLVGFTVEMPEEEEDGWIFGEVVPVCGGCFREATEKVAGSS